MALDQYFVNLNEQLKAGKISNAEYTEKYMAYGYAQRVSRLEAAGIGKENTNYKPSYLDSKSYKAIVYGTPAETPTATPSLTPAPSKVTPTIEQMAFPTDAQSNFITDGTTKPPNYLLLAIIAVIALIFID